MTFSFFFFFSVFSQVTASLINVTEVARRIEPPQIEELFRPAIPATLESVSKEAGLEWLSARCSSE